MIFAARITLDPLHTAPVARITPQNLEQPSGTVIILDAGASTFAGDDAVTITWSFTAIPAGADAPTIRTLSDVVSSFVPTVSGQYSVQLVLSTQWRTSAPATCTWTVRESPGLLSVGETPDASFFFRVLSDFWKEVGNRNALTVLWSGYLQLTSELLVRAYETRLLRSLRTAQTKSQRRWIPIHPRVALSGGLIRYFDPQAGTGAFTRKLPSAIRGYVIGLREFMPEGHTSPLARGSDLTILSGENLGTYKVTDVTSRSYIVSPSSPFLRVARDVRQSGVCSTVAGSATVSRVGTFIADIGDVLYILSGDSAGYYTITGVSSNTLTVQSPFLTSASGRHYEILRRVSAQLATTTSTTQDVGVPMEADFNVVIEKSLAGTGELLSPTEIRVAARHIFEGAGRKIRVLSGSNSGKDFTITAVNATRATYTVAPAFTETSYPVRVAYAVENPSSHGNILLSVGGESYSVLRAQEEHDVPVEDGGYGDFWRVHIDGAVPTGRSDMDWEFGSVFVGSEDYEQLGVKRGDVFLLRITRTDTLAEGTLRCRVIAAREKRIAFCLGVGVSGVTPDEWVALAEELAVRGVASVDGELVLSGEGQALYSVLSSRRIRQSYVGVPVGSAAVVDLGVFSVRLAGSGVIRNSRISIDTNIVSVPELRAFIRTPTIENGSYEAADGTDVAAESAVILTENEHFTVADGYIEVDGYTPSASLPEEMWAPTVLGDVTSRVEAAYGLALGLTHTQYASAQSALAYVDVLRVLLYAWVSAPRIQAVEAGVASLIGSPVLTERAVVLRVEDMDGTRARLWVELLDRTGRPLGIVRALSFQKEGDGVTSGFGGLQIHTSTGRPIARGDVIAPFLSVSRAVSVVDIQKDPTWWWRIGRLRHEIQKVHTWGVIIDAASISGDLSRVPSFLREIAPAHTRAMLIVNRQLVDVITPSSKLTFEAELHMLDSPAFSAESSFVADATNDSGVQLGRFGIGAHATRVFFTGDDLVMESGGFVQSARGGFTTGGSMHIRDGFTRQTTVLGDKMVSVGDVVLVLTGPNEGAYRVVDVLGDTRLAVEPAGEYGDYTPVDEWEESTALFSILRLQQNPVFAGTATCEAASTTLVFEGMDLIAAGVAVGDWVIAREAGVLLGRFRITALDRDMLAISEATEAEGTFQVEITRDGLVGDVTASFSSLSGTAGDTWFTAPREVLTFWAPGDELRGVSGDYRECEFTVLMIEGDRIYVREELADTGSGAFTLHHPQFEGVDSGSSRLSELWPEEGVTMTLYDPMSSPGSVGLEIDGSSITAFADLRVFGDTAYMSLIFDEADGGGVYEITDVGVDGLTASGSSSMPQGSVTADVSCRVADFLVALDAVISDSSEDFEAMGIKPGDVVTLDGVGDFYILYVAGSALTLTVDTGVPAPTAMYGRVTRRLC